jgi:hypothetical protein
LGFCHTQTHSCKCDNNLCGCVKLFLDEEFVLCLFYSYFSICLYGEGGTVSLKLRILSVDAIKKKMFVWEWRNYTMNVSIMLLAIKLRVNKCLGDIPLSFYWQWRRNVLELVIFTWLADTLLFVNIFCTFAHTTNSVTMMMLMLGC